MTTMSGVNNDNESFASMLVEQKGEMTARSKYRYIICVVYIVSYPKVVANVVEIYRKLTFYMKFCYFSPGFVRDFFKTD